MSTWQDITLGDVCKLRAGNPFKTAEQGAPHGDLPFIKVSDMNLPGNWSRIQESNNWVTFEQASRLKLKPFDSGTVVFAKIGEALKQNRVRLLASRTVIDNNMMGASPQTDVVDRRFFYYLMSTVDLAATATGTAVPYLTVTTLKRLPLSIPDLPTQKAIADVLGAFDDLIENNRRRIEVLEEMARAIYREWFVKFRYPGHSDVPMVDSALGPIPEGWAVSRLDEVATLSGGSTITKSAYVDSGFVAFSAAGPDGFLPEFEVDGPGVVLSAVGARCGRAFWASGKWASIANTIKILPKDPALLANWLRFVTDDPGIWPKRGSAQPFVSINDARGVLAVRADCETHLRFEQVAGPMIDEAVVLQAAMKTLATVRDALLPKLVTGQIDVSSLDLDTVIAEQVA